MKKIYLVLISIFTLALSSVLAACTFKEAKASFSQEQILFDTTETQEINLDDFFNVENVDKAEFRFVCSDQAPFTISGHNVLAKAGESGRGFVNALYKGNNLAKTEVVVMKKFSAPNNVRWDEKGFVTWDAVSGMFDGETTLTSATQFLVRGQKLTRANDGLGDVIQTEYIDQIVQKQAFSLLEKGEGEYVIQVKALKNGYFSSSDFSEEKRFFVGYMPELKKENFSFENGTTLKWNTDVLAQAVTKFQVKLDGRLVGEQQSEASFDFSSVLDMDSEAYGAHTVSVIVYDYSNSKDKKLAKESEPVTIIKLRQPDIAYQFDETGGQIKFSSGDDTKEVDVVLKSEGSSFSYTFDVSNGAVLTSFEGALGQELPAGVYSLEAVGQAPNTEEAFYFRSKAKTLETKILKLEKATLEGANEENALDAAAFKVVAKRTSPTVATKFLISSIAGTFDGFDAESVQKAFDIEIPVDRQSESVFKFALSQRPLQEENEFSGESVFVLNGDQGEETEFVKLPKISGQLTHTYSGDDGAKISTLTFDEISVESEKVVTYKLKVKTAEGFDDIDVEADVQESAIRFVLDGPIEQLFEPVEGKYTFVVETNTNQASLTIGSSTEWSFDVLSAPVAITEQDNIWAGDSFEWQAVDGETPERYRLEVYTITKEAFEENRQQAGSFDPQSVGAEKQDIFQAETSKVFETEGYYFLKIFALAGDNDGIISSHDFLPVMLAVSKQLEIGQVKFGFDETLRLTGDENTGYYVEIETLDTNVKAFEISVDQESRTFKKTADNRYALWEDFSEEKTYEISIVAHWTDAEGQNDDLKYVVAKDDFEVVRLAKVGFSDFVFDERTFVLQIANGENTKVEVENVDNDQIVIEDVDGATQVKLGENTNFSLKFQRLSEQGYSFVEAGEKKQVLLDSADTQIKFQRLSAPTQFDFDSGVLSFTHENDIELPNVQYVLDVTLKGSSIGDASARIFLKQNDDANTVKIDYDGTSIERSVNKGEGKDLFTLTGSGAEIAVGRLLKALDGRLGNIYAATTNVDFSLWAKYVNDKTSEGIVELSSPLATAQNLDIILNVGKMKSVTIEFVQQGGYALTWKDNEDSAIQGKTKFVVHQNSISGNKTISESEFDGLRFSLENADFVTQTGVTFTYYVEATNPECLDSSASNKIEVLKNSKISRLHFGEDGTLSFTLPSENLFSGVEVKNGEAVVESPSKGKVTISGEGEYTFQIKGRGKVENEGVTSYFLDSDISKWTLKKLSTIKTEPQNVTFDKNVISWEYPFTETDIGVEFVLFFKDSSMALKQYVATTEESQAGKVDFGTNAKLRDILGALATGEVQVQVAAHVSQRYVEEGGVIYFEPEQQIPLRDEQAFNYYLLSSAPAKITKLKAPTVENVEFTGFNTEGIDDPEAWENRQNPTLKITISGNYGDGAKFSVYVNDGELPLEDLNFQKDETGNYYFELTSDQYSPYAKNGQVMRLKIFAIDGGTGSGVGSLPSSGTDLTISRAAQIDQVKLLEDDCGKGLSRIVELSIDPAFESQFSGNKVVLKVVCTPNDTKAAATKFFLSDIVLADGKIRLTEEANIELSKFIDESLAKGGKLTISAYADNLSVKDSKYVISCSEAQTSAEYQVLQSVEQTNVSRTAEGFTISGVTYNDSLTIYVLEYKSLDGQTKTSEILNSKDGFVFDIPAYWGEQAEFSIFAVKDDPNFVRSTKTQITYSLQRLEQVGEVSLSARDTDLSLKLEWNKVTNATEYLVQAFVRNADGQKGEFLCEKTLENGAEKISLEISDLFGENYAALDGKDLTKDFALVIEITAIGNAEHNNSLPFAIYPTIKGNPVSVENGDVFVKDGLAYFNAPSGYHFKYRFVRPNSAENLTSWQDVPANGPLDTSGEKFEKMQDPRFDIEIFVMADQSTSAGSNFVFDSYIFSTRNDDSFTFEKLAEIKSVTYDTENEKILIEFADDAQAVNTVLVGVDQNALTEHKFVTITLQNEESTTFSAPLYELLSKFEEASIDCSKVSNICFWSHKESLEGTKFVASQRYDFAFAFKAEFAVKEVKRLQEIKPVPEDSNEDGNLVDFVSGWTTTYLLFDNTDDSTKTTTSIFVKITHRDTGREFIFSTSEENGKLVSNLKENMYAINLSQIFDSDLKIVIEGESEDETTEIFLSNLFGMFDIAVMKVGTINGVSCVSDWVKTVDGKALSFQRLEPIRAIELRSGNLYWNTAEDVVDEFYVYFFDLDEEGVEGAYRIVRPSKMTNEEGKTVPRTWLDASSFALEKHSYHLAVQSVDYDNPFVLASKVTYIMTRSDGTGEKSTIYKNQADTEKSPLKLRADGTLTIDWAKNEDDEGNFITALTRQNSSPRDLATMIATKVFTSPFTFTINDLINNQVQIKLRFRQIGDELGAYKTCVVDSFVLLQDLIDFYNKTAGRQLDELLRNLHDSVSGDVQTIIENFTAAISNKKSGIGTSEIFMDDYFEGLQAGRYTMQYCILGNSHTLNSEWYAFKNEKTNSNLFGINAAPQVSIVKTAAENTPTNLFNTFEVKIKKSQIETENEGKRAEAERYYVRIGSHSFEISKLDRTYVLKLVGDDQDRQVTVQNKDEFLSFYLNMNNGDSLLGEFGDLLPRNNTEQAFEVCAVGNETSLSSKSDVFKMTFLAFMDFGISEGKFQWSIPSNSVKTKIVVKQQQNNILLLGTAKESLSTATFGLEDEQLFGEGMYDYVKFVLTVDNADLKENVVFVDSDVYVVKNVFKLYAPEKLTNDYGQIGIQMQSANFNVLKEIYSDANPFTYQIENDVSINSTVPRTKIEDERPMEERSKELLYTAGVTGLNREDLGAGVDDYDYKLTEQRATHFDVTALGTSAILRPKETDQYNVKEMLCEKAPNELVEFGTKANVAVSSKKKGIDARMLESVTSASVENGILVWDGITTRETLPKTASVVYRLDIERYSFAPGEETRNFVPVINTVYTADTSFDLSTLTKDEFDRDNIFFQVTIRALALEIGEGLSASVTLQDGRHAGGNVKFEADAAGKEKFVLLSEGFVKDGISRLASVVKGSVKVEKHELTWKYTTTDPDVTEENFKEHFDFVVIDNADQPFEVVGDFDVSLETNEGGLKTFVITFKEDENNVGKPGSLTGGSHNITVFANNAEGSVAEVVRSFGESATIVKLARIEDGDFDVETNYENQLETLSLENYFKQNPNNFVTARFEIDQNVTEIQLSNSDQKIYILREGTEQPTFKDGDKYSRQTITIGENVIVKVTFVATGADDTLSSDTSDVYDMSRTSWAEDASIQWNGTKGEFSWETDAEEYREFVIEVDYTYQTEGASQTSVKRIYHSSSKSFKPTIIGKVKISIRLKLNGNSLQSKELTHIVDSAGAEVLTDEDGREYVNFNLFSSGMGTSEHPYIIGGYVEGGDVPTNEKQFRNIAYRKTKQEDYLENFVEIDSLGRESKTEDKKYYFRLDEDLNLDDIQGILFTGEFDGVILGNDHSITYNSSSTLSLSSPIAISASNNVAEITPSQRAISFGRGSALFETLNSTARIEKLKIHATFGAESTRIVGHSILAGLAISNNGEIDGVQLMGYESKFLAQDGGDVMVYAGLVGLNIGISASIENCSAQTNIQISDHGRRQFIFVSGIVYTNEATVTKCISGMDGQSIKVDCTNTASVVQVAGIAITNTMSGGSKMTECTNNYDISIDGPQDNNINCYVSGVVVLGQNMSTTRDSNHNTGDFSFGANIKKENIVKQDDGIIATTTAIPTKTSTPSSVS